jgi:hypothetical protein
MNDCHTPALPQEPHLEPEALSVFDLHVGGAACYLEYGSGGSTVRAAQIGAQHIIAVDSCSDWIAAVRAGTGAAGNVHLLYCDIGAVGAWGRPVDTQGIRAYHRYMSMPWELARQNSLDPAVILIDGRFRVACFLFSLLNASEGSVILFDDYVNREHYHVVEAFCQPSTRHGRMAVFEVHKQFSLPDIVARIAEYSIIPD